MADQAASAREVLTVGEARAQARWDYTPPTVRPLPGPIRFLRVRCFMIFMCIVLLGPVLYLIVELAFVDFNNWISVKDWLEKLKYASIPIVSVAFTYWHVWLGIQMCWYPIEFVGYPPVFGWQGIVPRRAGIMAERSCDLMIGNLITVEEIIERIEPDDFFRKLGPVLGNTCAAVMQRLAVKHCPQVWALLPASVRAELNQKVLEESQKMFRPIITDIKQNVNRIFNIKQMAVEALISDKPLLVSMFQEIGRKEFTFVMHVAAVVGAIMGFVQMAIYAHFQAWWILPLSGLLIGYFTNWLAITMIFKPVQPHIICGGYINIQGVFLKRQQQVATELSSMICTKLIYARRMLEFVVRSESFEEVLEIYQRHMEKAIDSVLGKSSLMLPVFVGQNAIEGIKNEAIQFTLDELPNHSKEIEDYMDKTFALADTIGPRLRGLPPEQFEGMLRPVFQEDEWMVLLLGGVLGVLVGSMQALVLGQ